MPVTFFALHGFLGQPEDWHFWKKENFIACSVNPDSSLNSWAKNFNGWVKLQKPGPKILVGYSMGGRLALHALLDEPSLWQKAILISTHFGLSEEQDKHKRVLSDLAWAKRFCHDPWEKLMNDWENQSVFKTAQVRPVRLEAQYNRENLASHLQNFSIGKQRNLLPEIAKLTIPIDWITGSKDIKFDELAKKAAQVHLYSAHHSIPHGSHRVHLEYPELINKFF